MRMKRTNLWKRWMSKVMSIGKLGPIREWLYQLLKEKSMWTSGNTMRRMGPSFQEKKESLFKQMYGKISNHSSMTLINHWLAREETKRSRKNDLRVFIIGIFHSSSINNSLFFINHIDAILLSTSFAFTFFLSGRTYSPLHFRSSSA